MKNKRGSHVGIILSFVIFVTFLLFVLTTLRPMMQNTEQQNNLVFYIESEIIKDTSGILYHATVAPELNSNGKRLIRLNANLLGIENWNDYYVLVKDNQENKINIEKTPQFLIFNYNSDLYQIYFANSSLNEKLENMNGAQVNAEVKFFENKKIIFKTKLLEFFEKYNLDYESLKSELKISPTKDFSLEFLNSSKEIIIKTETSKTAKNVYAKEIPIQYVNKEAEQKQGFLKVYVW